MLTANRTIFTKSSRQYMNSNTNHIQLKDRPKRSAYIVSRMSSYFPNRWPLSYLNLIKNMKTYIRRQQHKKFKHQDIKQKEPPQKGTSRQRSGKGAIRKRLPLQKPRWEKTKPTIRHLYHETYRKPNEQLFSQ